MLTILGICFEKFTLSKDKVIYLEASPIKVGPQRKICLSIHKTDSTYMIADSRANPLLLKVKLILRVTNNTKCVFIKNRKLMIHTTNRLIESWIDNIFISKNF